MGGIAIWSMHSIVNYSIVLGDGPRRSDLQIVYSPGFTASSFFLPIAVVFLAFCAVGYDDIVSFPRIIIGGILTGFGICGMHYVGQAGISNYTCEYELRFVILSVVIACFYSIVALGMFFKPRSASWWKRGIAAAILATGVSGMHVTNPFLPSFLLLNVAVLGLPKSVSSSRLLLSTEIKVLIRCSGLLQSQRNID